MSMDVGEYGAVDKKSNINLGSLNEKNAPQSFAKSTVLIGIGAAILFVVGTVNFDSHQYGSINGSDLLEVDSLQVSFSNKYTAKYGHPATDYRWLQEGRLVEPHRTTNVQISGITDSIDNLKITASCQATHKQSGEVVEGTDEKNTACNLFFTQLGDYVVEVSLSHADTGSLHTLTVDVMSRYVRRDLRKLSEEDRAAYLDAARVLYDIPSVQGQLIYGENYHDMVYFADIHMANAVPNKHHDRMHDGMGFVSQHLALTNEYELALQAVNPTVALPYWDFTQDFVMIKEIAKAKGREVEYKDLWSLDIWGEDIFGKAEGDLHTVTSGRWAYTHVSKQPSANKDFVANPYGFMRAPWNLNPSPYVTRYHQLCGMDEGEKGSDLGNQWPSCSEHHSLVFDIDDLPSFVYYMANGGHGGVHVMIGGMGGDCEDWGKMTGLIGPAAVKSIKAYAAFLGRYAYRQDYCEMPSHEKCNGNIHGHAESCKLYFPGCDAEKFTAEQIDKYIDLMEMEELVTTDFQKEQLVRTVLCESKILLGDQIESASASDVTFWPIHPTLERLMQYKQLVHPLTVGWDSSYYDSNNWSLDGCMWGKVFDADCIGHGKHDSTYGMTSSYDKDAGEFVKKYLTNGEVLALQEPTNSWKLPYVYDSFDYKHCEKEGIIFKRIPKA